MPSDKEDKAGWSGFLEHLKQRGLKGVRLFISDACIGLIESLADYYPDSRWQRCAVHFYRNVFSVVPRGTVAGVALMLKENHACEDKAVAKVRDMIHETLVYYYFPSHHQAKIRTNNPLERLMREIRRRTRVVGAFPDGHSVLMLSAARLRHAAGTKWGLKRYMDMGVFCNAAEMLEAVA